MMNGGRKVMDLYNHIIKVAKSIREELSRDYQKKDGNIEIMMLLSSYCFRFSSSCLLWILKEI